MPKARLQLIVCSDGPEARDRRRDRGFRPSVIDGGKRAIAMPAADPWQALLELFDLGLLVSRTNYLAFVAASLAAFELLPPRIQLSSPGLTGRSSIPETPMIESIGRSVLDGPVKPGDEN
jgi:hypothetical protein